MKTHLWNWQTGKMKFIEKKMFTKPQAKNRHAVNSLKFFI